MNWSKITAGTRFPKNRWIILYDPEPFLNGIPHCDMFFYDGNIFVDRKEDNCYSLDDIFNSNFSHYMALREPCLTTIYYFDDEGKRRL